MVRRGGLETALGQILRERRLAAGLSQEQLAEAADLHRNYVGLIERGQTSPSLSALTGLAHALGKLPSELLREAEAHAGLADHIGGH